MRQRLLLMLTLSIALFVAGCGAAKTNTGAPGATNPSPTTATGTAAPADCPTQNTKAFAKSRFVADLGGSLFLLHRYIVKPYQAGTFTKGANGRTVALIKAAAAAAATAKLLSNAKDNAKANPTLCRSVAGPLGQISGQLGNLVGSLRSGAVNPGTIAGLSGLASTVQQKAGAAGVAVQEQPTPLG